MILTNEQIELFTKCIGLGPADKASVIIFANEFGTSGGGGGTQACVSKFMGEFETRKLLQIGEGFTIIDIDPPPVSSTFLQFVSRLMLALKHQDDRFFDELTIQGRLVLNDYIMNHLYREDSVMLNIRPYPQPSEDTWCYDNIDRIGYHNNYNFSLRGHRDDKFRDIRLSILKEAFRISNGLILGSGDKENKKYFFQTIYPTIQFHELKLSDSYKIYYSNNLEKKIILSNYFDNRTIGLSNFKKLFHFIVDFNKPIIPPQKSTSVQLF